MLRVRASCARCSRTPPSADAQPEEAPCCRLGKGVLGSLMGGGGSPERGAATASGCIDLTADAGAVGARAAESDESESEEEAEMEALVARLARQRRAREAAAHAAPRPGGAPAERRCELVLGLGLGLGLG